MTDYAGDAPTEAGATVTQRTGTGSADTVPAGCLLLLNALTAQHNVDLTISALWHGLQPGSSGAPGKRRIVVGTGTWVAVRVPFEMGDANGRVAVTIDGIASDVKYHVLGV